MKTETRTDVYTRVTNSIIAELEKGVRPWMKPWNGDYAAGRIAQPLRGNGVPYKGINILLLWMSAVENGFSSSTWMTFKQAITLGGCVRKGQHGSLVVYADAIQKTGQDETTGEDVELRIPFMKSYSVFNLDQIDGLPERIHTSAPCPTLSDADRIVKAEAFFSNTGIVMRENGTRAFYSLDRDEVTMPPFVFFRDPESFYSTLGHEYCHATRHPSRLNRDLGRKHWGDEGHSHEELVAELGACFLCADLNLTPETRDDHAAYFHNWLKGLKNDRRFIFSAAAHAQRAVEWLHAQQPGQDVTSSLSEDIGEAT
jgi:antirestriction protein ArdC